MARTREIEKRFWKALGSDMTMMLGLVGVDEGHTRPMTAQVEGEKGPIWFFTSDGKRSRRKSEAPPPRHRHFRFEGKRSFRGRARQPRVGQ